MMRPHLNLYSYMVYMCNVNHCFSLNRLNHNLFRHTFVLFYLTWPNIHLLSYLTWPDIHLLSYLTCPDIYLLSYLTWPDIPGYICSVIRYLAWHTFAVLPYLAWHTIGVLPYLARCALMCFTLFNYLRCLNQWVPYQYSGFPGTWRSGKPGDLNCICPGPEIAGNLPPKVEKPGQKKKFSWKHG